MRWSDGITFLEPGGGRTKLRPAPLPAPLHSTPSFLSAKVLGWRDKLAIARAISAFLRGSRAEGRPPELCRLGSERTGQTKRAVEHFWKPVLFSALNEDPDRISVRYAAKVFREAFLFSAEAGRMGVPRVPFSEMYGQVAAAIEQAGGKVHLRSTVEGLCHDEESARWRLRIADHVEVFDAVVLALSFEGLQKLLPALPDEAPRDPAGKSAGEIQPFAADRHPSLVRSEITRAGTCGAARHHCAVALQHIAHSAGAAVRAGWPSYRAGGQRVEIAGTRWSGRRLSISRLASWRSSFRPCSRRAC